VGGGGGCWGLCLGAWGLLWGGWGWGGVLRVDMEMLFGGWGGGGVCVFFVGGGFRGGGVHIQGEGTGAWGASTFKKKRGARAMVGQGDRGVAQKRRKTRVKVGG